MFKNFNIPQNKKKIGTNTKEMDRLKETTNEEFQIPLLQRAKNFTMTAELEHRMEIEKLRRKYQLPSSKIGAYL